mmetsp:Transcript_15128/g.30113  ORF Transcript_15128/g.30113 Transcript_15128/m.30113 type:complete len:130 (-) Transcript_15128:59-448(-)|eukprot:CAMPEP_0182460110 /NCGR_PEP_ID=MMETSP1319-20130603/5070_1 /TAXON_ID=172717 /ORGANISM="Bolidomonas pacifica, Strain RCC208" /LENGTH=129 /DNA_ID=CAMNT_0024659157 /DNA_START=324 /DNA_END=713 /DNA_ORIENTATION=-
MSDEVTFTGGSLGFLKKKKKKKSKKKRKLEEANVEGEGGEQQQQQQQQDDAAKEEKEKSSSAPPGSDSEDDDLTAFERAHIRKKRAKEARDTAAITTKSHRERVDEFNQGLSTLTEHNDIPRISAAGNG